MSRSTHDATAELSSRLADEITEVRTWPAMAKFVARCIDAVRAHEHARRVYLARAAERDAELAALKRECDALRAKLSDVA